MANQKFTVKLHFKQNNRDARARTSLLKTVYLNEKLSLFMLHQVEHRISLEL